VDVLFAAERGIGHLPSSSVFREDGFFEASLVGRAGPHGDVKQNQEDESTKAIAGTSSPEHSVEDVVENAGENIEGNESDPHEHHKGGHDHGDERGHLEPRR